ncbi:MAG: dihydroorotase [Rhodospirillaceae bacterium]|nr:dihydroorotase [Rhodospirillaceae bacterium]
MTGTVYKNARLLDPENSMDATGALLVKDGYIVDSGPHVFVDAVQDDWEVVDCGGKCLAPGLIDMRVTTGEPGNEHLETLATVSQAAAAGGVTNMVCLPNTYPVVDDVALLEFVERRAAEVGLISVHSYAAATKGTRGEEMSEVGLLHEAGALGFTDGSKAISNAMVMRRLLSYATVFDALIIQHPEVRELVGSGVMSEGETATRLGLTGIPAAAEVMMIERDIRLVEITHGRYHASRVTTAQSVEAIAEAKAAGLPVTCDTAPHYFALNEGAVNDYRTFAKVSPPLRTEEDRRAVLAGIADGTIDAIASDHTPRDQDSKRLPFDQAAHGVVGLETMLTITLEAVHNGGLTMLDAIAALTQRPARILGLNAGTLAKGAAADLLIFDPDIASQIDAAKFQSKCKNSPFDGKPIQGRVLKTIRRGKTVFNHNAEEGPHPGRSAHA